ncbi:MAG TPA: hypothetical protein VFD13_01765 [Candidatus Kapabacteria bacterium]|nr:hypothetical protein [Candidatus Kapabacteria bacterium]
MKTLLPRTNAALLFAACFVAASLLSSCKQDPQSALGPNLPLNSPSTPAHPALTYISSVTSHRTTYATVGVMDTDGSHATNIVTASSSSDIYSSACWSPTASSIAWSDILGTGSYASAIKAVDVSVNSGGVPVGSNVRTIYSTSNSDSMVITGGLAWCSASTTGEIAFIREHFNAANWGLYELCTISQSGGTVTVLQSYKKLRTQNGNTYVAGHYGSPTWNSDDSKIAFDRADTNGHHTIVIASASTGVTSDSIPLSLAGVGGIEWSRSGIDKLVYNSTPNSSTPWEIYYVAPATGSTPTTNSVQGTAPTWSPNNSEVMYASSGLKKMQAFTSSSISISGTPAQVVKWKR